MKYKTGNTVKNFLVQHKRKILVSLILVVLLAIVYVTVFKSVTIHPLQERNAMMQLEENKKLVELQEFETDGCSGNVSNLWTKVVVSLSDTFESFDEKYKDAQSIPFEDACVEHDKKYHAGEGGYVGRLQADNELRDAILRYAVENTEDVKERTGLETDETTLFLYESIAELVYRGVRLGGAPCTGKSYAWGYGYGGGSCME